MAPLGLYTAVGGNESNKSSSESRNPNIAIHSNKIAIENEGMNSNEAGIKNQHLPYSSHLNEFNNNGVTSIDCRNFNTTQQQQSCQPQDLVTFNASIMTMNASPHIRSGMKCSLQYIFETITRFTSIDNSIEILPK